MRELCDAARALDGTRPVSYVTDMPDEPGIDTADIIFLNSYPGWYRHPGELDVAESVLARTLDRVHERYRKPVVLSSPA
jgi:hypothetical protein